MPQNPYVEATLVNTLSFIAHSKGSQALRAFSVSIHGDNAFYVMENAVDAPSSFSLSASASASASLSLSLFLSRSLSLSLSLLLLL